MTSVLLLWSPVSTLRPLGINQIASLFILFLKCSEFLHITEVCPLPGAHVLILFVGLPSNHSQMAFPL